MKRLTMMVVLAATAMTCAADEAELARAEFAKYCRMATGKAPAADAVKFIIDAAISKTGNDAYAIRSEGDGVTITGSNGRSLFYGVYDLLERRAGCCWFWDGDKVPHRERIDLSGLDVREEARFEYRAIRYFAHRGLTRFQAEHWGPEEWKREIDWCLKRRLNCFMPRIGMDDTWQKAFPEIVPYPDPAAPADDNMKGFNNRVSGWGLKYRGELRKLFTEYAFARGLMIPTDFGTMTHWYARTPTQFLERKNPPFLPISNNQYPERTGLVWDVFRGEWLDDYWHLTEAFLGAGYGRPDLLHTIGLGERMCFEDREKNLQMKKAVLRLLTEKALSAHPDSKILLAGWDFYSTWKPEEVRSLIPHLDPKRVMLWDYEAEADLGTDYYTLEKPGDFTQWGVVGRFPYTFGIFLAYENALDVRARYETIEKREKVAADDPFCRGYILWPESSHTDTLLLRYFTANAWKPGQTHDALLPQFCRDRYGEDAAAFESAWRRTIPISNMQGWGGNWGSDLIYFGDGRGREETKFNADRSALESAPGILADLAAIDPKDDFARRDMMDLARTVIDRRLIADRHSLLVLFDSWCAGKADAAPVKRAAESYLKLVRAATDLLALHTDYSLCESLDRLAAVRRIEAPDFDRVLLDNASCDYCRSHQYEIAAGWYLPFAEDVVAEFKRKLEAGDRTAIGRPFLDAARTARKRELDEKRIFAFRPTLPRTAAEFRRVMHDAASAMGAAAGETEIPEGYRRLWNDELNAAIDARIEKFRKADACVEIPVPDGTEVKVVQTESDFRFGCNIFNFDQFGDDRRNAAYRAEFMTGGLFNAATVPFYWGALEPERGRPRFEREAASEPAYWTTHGDGDVAWRRPAPDPVLDFLEANGASVHGHAIIYARYHPAWTNAKMALEDRWKLYERHIAEIAGKYGSRLPQWDVVNESIDINSPASAPTDAHPEQPTNYTLRSFRVAGNAFPAGVKKCINGVYVGENYPAFIAKLVKDGAPIDVIGHQMHIFSDEEVMQVASGQTVHPNYVSWKPADQIAMFKKYDEIGLPIHVSEITVPAPTKLLSRDDAERLQARVLRDCYRLWFSWPSVYRITYWNMVDGMGAGNEILESGLLRNDMTRKPAYHALWRLVHNDWRTSLTTRAVGGKITFRGFKGRYRLSWRGTDGKETSRIVDLR